MPFVSQAQQGFLHAHPEVLGKAKLHEFDEATKGMHNLPKHVHKSASYAMPREVRRHGQARE